MNNNVLPLAKINRHLSDYLNRVKNGSEIITITQNGIPTGCLIGYEELCSLYETLDILSDPNALKDIKESKEEIKKGEYITGDKLGKELKLDE